MNANLNHPSADQSDLARVIEPLASYICAADRPRAALASALAVLVREIEQTNHAAAELCGAWVRA
jgi:hypothetical protein